MTAAEQRKKPHARPEDRTDVDGRLARPAHHPPGREGNERSWVQSSAMALTHERPTTDVHLGPELLSSCDIGAPAAKISTLINAACTHTPRSFILLPHRASFDRRHVLVFW